MSIDGEDAASRGAADGKQTAVGCRDISDPGQTAAKEGPDTKTNMFPASRKETPCLKQARLQRRAVTHQEAQEDSLRDTSGFVRGERKRARFSI